MIDMVPPMHGAAREARNIYGEGERVANRDHPARMGREVEPPFNGETKTVFAYESCRDQPEPLGGESSAKQRQNQRMGDDHSGKAGGIDGADGSCPAKLVEPQAGETLLLARMSDREARNCDHEPL